MDLFFFQKYTIYRMYNYCKRKDYGLEKVIASLYLTGVNMVWLFVINSLVRMLSGYNVALSFYGKHVELYFILASIHLLIFTNKRIFFQIINKYSTESSKQSKYRFLLVTIYCSLPFLIMMYIIRFS